MMSENAMERPCIVGTQSATAGIVPSEMGMDGLR
jgi:hypothetical protein